MTTAQQILNTVRKYSSDDYINRVPIANRDNIKKVGDILLDKNNSDLYNEFITTLLDKIAFTFIHSKIYKNPLACLKNGSTGIPYGNKIEDVFVEPAKDVNFSQEVDSSIVLKTFHPQVEAAYYGLARKSTYAQSFDRQKILQAFSNQSNFMTFFQGIVNSLYSGDNIDEFLLMKNAVGAFIDAEVVDIVDTGDITTYEGSKALIKQIGLFSSNFVYPSKAYSPFNKQLKAKNPEISTEKLITTFCPTESQVLIITAEALNEITYEVLANIFNLELTEIKAKTIVIDEIPSSKHKINAMLCDKETINCIDHTYLMESEYIKGKMITQYFLNHWQWIWCSVFPNAIAFGSQKTE